MAIKFKMNLKKKTFAPQKTALLALCLPFHTRGTGTRRPPGGLRAQIELLSGVCCHEPGRGVSALWDITKG